MAVDRSKDRLETQRIMEVPFKLLVESVQDYAIFMLDPQGYIASWNRGAQRAKGYTEDEIVGKHFSTFYTEEDLARHHPEFELRVATETGRFEDEGWRVRKDGTRFWANVVITAVRDETGTLIGFGKVTRDLTERKMHEIREHELMREQQARAEAEAANEAKSLFLTTMSHELRTPLNAIIGYTDLLELGVQGPLTEEQKISLDRVRRSSKHLLSLINDLLNIARVEGGQVDYAIQDVTAREILDGVEPLVTPQFASNGIALVRDDCNEELRVECDIDKAQQVLLNLLTNAYKFTRPGGEVKLKCDATPEMVVFSVIDNGRGIPAERLDQIFEPFVQIDRHLNRTSQQGIGLGLSISRDLARGMGGDLEVESQLAVGSTFRLSLPRAR
jgi:PAS domain S-box-containing protein